MIVNDRAKRSRGGLLGRDDLDLHLRSPALAAAVEARAQRAPDEQPDRVDHHLYAGDTVEPLHLLYDVQTQEPVQEPGGGLAITFGRPITLAPDSALRPEPLAAGTHTLILSVTDLADGVGFSPPLTVTAA